MLSAIIKEYFPQLSSKTVKIIHNNYLIISVNSEQKNTSCVKSVRIGCTWVGLVSESIE